MKKKKKEEKSKNLDSLKFPEIRRLLDKMAKSLGFRLSHCPLDSRKSYWLLSVEFQTAKDLLREILNSRIFKLRSLKSYDEKLLENPFYSLDLSALQIKLDLLA